MRAKTIFRVGVTAATLLFIGLPLSVFAASTGFIGPTIQPDGGIQGWALLPGDQPKTISVKFYIDGTNTTGSYAGSMLAQDPSPDLLTTLNYTGNHRYLWNVPNYWRDNKTHTVYAYGIDPVTNELTQLYGSPFTFSLAGPSGAATISAPVLGSTFTLTTSPTIAGAINSLMWNGKQFVSNGGTTLLYPDHGSSWQMALILDNYGACYNPTEAGSRSDGLWPFSTSILRSITTTATSLATHTQAANWLRPGETEYDCYIGATAAVNTKELSDFYLDKTVTLGFQGIDNVIVYKSSFNMPEAHSGAQIEGPTGYMPLEFSNFWTYNPVTKDLESVTALYKNVDGTVSGIEVPFPTIFSTSDKQYAVGIYSPDLPVADFPLEGYGIFKTAYVAYTNVSKWNCVFRTKGLIVGNTYTSTCYIAIGTVSDVQTAIDKLYAYFKPGYRAQGYLNK